MNRNLALAMIIVGTLILAALAAFIAIALGYRHSFTSSDVPIGDFLEGLFYMSPVADGRRTDLLRLSLAQKA